MQYANPYLDKNAEKLRKDNLKMMHNSKIEKNLQSSKDLNRNNSIDLIISNRSRSSAGSRKISHTIKENKNKEKLKDN